MRGFKFTYSDGGSLGNDYSKGVVQDYAKKDKFTEQRMFGAGANHVKVDHKTNSYMKPKSKFGKKLEDEYQKKLKEVKAGNTKGVKVGKSGVVTFDMDGKSYRLGKFDKDYVGTKKKDKTVDKTVDKDTKAVKDSKAKAKTIEKKDPKKETVAKKTKKEPVKSDKKTVKKQESVEKDKTTEKKPKKIEYINSSVHADIVSGPSSDMPTTDAHPNAWMKPTFDRETAMGYKNFGYTTDANDNLTQDQAYNKVFEHMDPAISELPAPLREMAADWDFNHAQDARLGLLSTAGLIDDAERQAMYNDGTQDMDAIDAMWAKWKDRVMSSYDNSPKGFMYAYKNMKDRLYAGTAGAETHLGEWGERNDNSYLSALRMLNTPQKKNGGKFNFTYKKFFGGGGIDLEKQALARKSMAQVSNIGMGQAPLSGMSGVEGSEQGMTDMDWNQDKESDRVMCGSPAIARTEQELKAQTANSLDADGNPSPMAALARVKLQRHYKEYAACYGKQFKHGGKTGEYNMVLLDHNGEPQMNMEGGELVVSRVKTKELVDAAVTTHDNDDFHALGKIMYQERIAQRKRDGE